VGPLLIRPAEPGDASQLAFLRHDLWPESALEEHQRELTSQLSGANIGLLPSIVFVAVDPAGGLVGFLEAGLRSHADGCDPAHPVGYVEGWYVAPAFRRMSVGARLMAEAESWARRQGCLEMASDTWIDNLDSQRAHLALGFQEVDRCVNYRKPLST